MTERSLVRIVCLFAFSAWLSALNAADEPSKLRVGSAAVEFEADDSMIIAGGITAGKATGQEGKLRATAVVLEKQPFGKLAIIACDVLMMTREWLRPLTVQIAENPGIALAHSLLN